MKSRSVSLMTVFSCLLFLCSIPNLSFSSGDHNHGTRHGHGQEPSSSGHSHGDGHGHDHKSHSHHKSLVPKGKIKDIGEYHIKRLIGMKKINESWTKAIHEKTVPKKFNGKTEWIATFKNEKGEKGKLLYVFVDVYGQFIAANFTGK